MVQAGSAARGTGGGGQPRPALGWAGSAAEGRIELTALDGRPLIFAALAELAEHLRTREDPHGGFVACAAALGVALHAMRCGRGDCSVALAEAGGLLAGLPVEALLAHLQACLRSHADLITGPTLAARLVLEARRLQRLQSEAVVRAVEAGRHAIPPHGVLLLAWPGSAACDLGAGLLTGALVASGRRHARAEELLISGPPALAAGAVAELAAHGLPAQAVTADEARAALPAAVLLRAGVIEASALHLAEAAARRRVPVLAIGIARPDATPLPRGCRACVVPPVAEAAC